MTWETDPKTTTTTDAAGNVGVSNPVSVYDYVAAKNAAEEANPQRTASGMAYRWIVDENGQPARRMYDPSVADQPSTDPGPVDINAGLWNKPPAQPSVVHVMPGSAPTPAPTPVPTPVPTPIPTLPPVRTGFLSWLRNRFR